MAYPFEVRGVQEESEPSLVRRPPRRHLTGPRSMACAPTSILEFSYGGTRMLLDFGLTGIRRFFGRMQVLQPYFRRKPRTPPTPAAVAAGKREARELGRIFSSRPGSSRRRPRIARLTFYEPIINIYLRNSQTTPTWDKIYPHGPCSFVGSAFRHS